MKNLKKYMAILTLVGVLGVSNTFAAGVIPPFRAGGGGHSLSSMFEEVYEYFQDLFEMDDETQTNDAGVIPPNRK